MILNDKKIIIIGSEGLIAKKIVDEILHEGGQPICLDLNIETDKNENRYNFDITNDQHIFFLDSPSLGKLNDKLIKFYANN